MENLNLNHKYKIIITTNFGLEAVVKRELFSLGYDKLKVSDRKIELEGTANDIARLNINLRCAERVYIALTSFKATSFEELFDKTYSFNWMDIIKKGGAFPVNGKSYKSKLFSISDSQRIVKKAIAERLKSEYKTDWVNEDGPRYQLEIDLNSDIATITLDTSGRGLHRRGYRTRAGDAPLKETLAAALVYLSFYSLDKDRTLIDPFCGSGTIPIEAAMIKRNIAPGLDREFDFMYWDNLGFDKAYEEAISEAMSKIDFDKKLSIIASDIDKWQIIKAKDNASRLGLEDDIKFFVKDFRKLDLRDDHSVLISNPPYGVRLGEEKEIEKLSIDLGEKFSKFKNLSLYFLTSFDEFEHFFGRKADRKRKLYNGKIKTNYYQYYGNKPKEV